jgi:hypothetical protein
MPDTHIKNDVSLDSGGAFLFLKNSLELNSVVMVVSATEVQGGKALLGLE